MSDESLRRTMIALGLEFEPSGAERTHPAESSRTAAQSGVDWAAVASKLNANLPPGAVIRGPSASLSPTAVYASRRAQVEEADRRARSNATGGVDWNAVATDLNATLPPGAFIPGRRAALDPSAVYAVRQAQVEGGK